jgi:hypothetical protein
MSKRILAAALAAGLLLPAAARADRRYYAETYSAATAEPGGLDVEGWTTLHRAPREGGTSVWRHQLELETGITESWDIALYNVWRHDFGDGTRYEAIKAESRYRLSQPGEWAVDPVLYLEVAKEVIDDKPWAIEEKLILARDLRAWNLSLNLVAEQEFIPGGGREYEWGYAAGTSLEVHPAVRIGGEIYGAWTNVRGGGASSWEKTHWAGPAVSLAWSRFWLVLGAGLALNDQSERMRLRAVVALQL